MKLRMNRGSHLPILMKLVQVTSGPILELGSGIYSTPFLHWHCFLTKRLLITYENNPQYIGYALQFKTDFHHVYFTSDWDLVYLNRPWSIAFVDHSPAERRAIEIRRLIHADYIVAHDTENSQASKYGYNSILKLFKYCYKFNEIRPNTTIFSNKHDVRHFSLNP